MEMSHFSRILSFWLLSSCFVYSFASVPISDEFSHEDAFLRKKYKEMDDNVKRLAHKSFKLVFPQLLEASENMNLSTPCMANLLSIGLGLRNLKPWAMQYVDATGKINDGMMNYNPHIVGDSDQCLAVASETKNGNIDFYGRYCLVRYRIYLPDASRAPDHILIARTFENIRNLSELLQLAVTKLQEGHRYPAYYGLCVPSGCGLRDVENMVKYVGDMVPMKLNVEYCHVQSDISYLSTRKLIIICIFVFFGLLGIISSATEYYSKVNNLKLKGKGFEVLKCFSIITNFPKLISTKTDTQVLSCLSGIRVLSTFYIILCHKFVTINNLNYSKNFLTNIYHYARTSIIYQILINGFVCVELFVFISGFVNIYMRMKLAGKGKQFNWRTLLIHRLWRIYPAYIIAILLQYLLTPRGPLGPVYEQQYIEDCNGEWWKNLLFINNFYPFGKCLEHTWYIACDMQYFLLALVAVPILMKNKKKGILVNTFLVACGLIITILWITLYKLGPSFIFVPTTPSGKDDNLPPYKSSASHMASYFLGVLLGYFMSTKKNIKTPKVFQAIGWIVASLVYTSMLFMTYRWNSGVLYTPAGSAFYFAFSKPLSAAAVGWIMFCCINGHGGIINYILSLKLWIPLSRLTYTMYLTSYPLQYFFLINRRTAVDTQWMQMIWEYVGDLGISILLALAISVLMESPLIRLEKLIFKGNSKGDEKNTDSFKSTPMKMNVIQESKAQNDSTTECEKC